MFRHLWILTLCAVMVLFSFSCARANSGYVDAPMGKLNPPANVAVSSDKPEAPSVKPVRPSDYTMEQTEALKEEPSHYPEKSGVRYKHHAKGETDKTYVGDEPSHYREKNAVRYKRYIK